MEYESQELLQEELRHIINPDLYQLVAINLRLYQLSGSKKYLKEMDKLLIDRDNGSNIYYCFYGVTNGYWVREKTIFGLKNLEKMWDSFILISGENHWIIHFFRAMTLYSIIKELPDIPLFEDMKEEGKVIVLEDISIIKKNKIPKEYKELLAEVEWVN